MSPIDGTTRRAIVAHAIAALAVGLPWPLLLVMVAADTDNPWLLGLAGSARMLPYVAISWLTARLADRMRRDLIVRATLVARTILLTATAIAVVTDHPWPGVVCCTLAVAIGTPAYPACGRRDARHRRSPAGSPPTCWSRSRSARSSSAPRWAG